MGRGIFKLSLDFEESYPSTPPKIKFVTPMYHPNVYKSGAICLDILKNNWSAVYNVSSLLLSIQSLLTDPNYNSLANVEAGKLYLENRVDYSNRVHKIVQASLQAIEDDLESEGEEEAVLGGMVTEQSKQF